eukprot:755782-Hanusia_phi.AAC.5
MEKKKERKEKGLVRLSSQIRCIDVAFDGDCYRQGCIWMGCLQPRYPVQGSQKTYQEGLLLFFFFLTIMITTNF